MSISYNTIIKNKKLSEFDDDMSEIAKPISEHDQELQVLDKLGVEESEKDEDEVL